MSAGLSKELRLKYKVKSLPIRKDDEVLIVRGSHKGHSGRVTECYRRKFVIHVDKIVREKVNGNCFSIWLIYYLGASVPVPIDTSNVVIITPKLTAERKDLLARKIKHKIVG